LQLLKQVAEIGLFQQRKFIPTVVK